jgi:hypothetical protein
MSLCPCCSSTLCRCIQQRKITWFCSRCRQEMPNFNSLESAKQFSNILSDRKILLENKEMIKLSTSVGEGLEHKLSVETKQ